jgi:hypothetical protein
MGLNMIRDIRRRYYSKRVTVRAQRVSVKVIRTHTPPCHAIVEFIVLPHCDIIDQKKPQTQSMRAKKNPRDAGY